MRSGEHPMDRCPREDDGTHMTVREYRYVTRARMTGPARDGGRRFARSSASPPPTDGGLTKVEQLRERIALGTYEVDSEAVAAAILKRLLGGDDK
jgi:Anti-sigma-28 factor, FlgM